MQSLIGIVRSAQRQICNNSSSKTVVSSSIKAWMIDSSMETSNGQFTQSVRKFTSSSPMASGVNSNGKLPSSLLFRSTLTSTSQHVAVTGGFPKRCISTAVNPLKSESNGSAAPVENVPPRIKFKRLDKTAGHIMKILDKEAVDEVRAKREIPDIKPGYIIQLKVETPENKRRITTMKGIVIARRNAGLNTTFRLRRLVAGVGVEALFPLYSPNIKEITVLDKKKVRRAKLYYLREKMNPLKKY